MVNLLRESLHQTGIEYVAKAVSVVVGASGWEFSPTPILVRQEGEKRQEIK